MNKVYIYDGSFISLIDLISYLISNNIEVTNSKIKYATENEYNINRLNTFISCIH